MKTGLSRTHRCRVAGLLLFVALTSAARGQLSGVSLGTAISGSTSSSASATTTVSRDIQGRVVNALDGAAIPRALVALNNRSALTDSQGRFEFRDFTDTQAYVTLTKPGFSQTDDMSNGNQRQRIPNLDVTLDLKIYPDAIVTGTVTGRDGLPLTRIHVSLRRRVFDQNGFRWVQAHSAQTDLHGEYRFREPAGRFQLAVGHVAKSVDTGEAVLPVTYPGNSSSGDQDYFEVASGQEKHIDLRPRTGLAYPITVHIDTQEVQRGVQFTAVTQSGESFQVPGVGQPGPGGMQVTVPIGTYTLHARLENRDTSLEGSTRVTVTGKQSDPVVIHLEPATDIPVELAIDPASAQSSTSTNSPFSFGQTLPAPDLRQFNLRLHNLSSSLLPGMQDISLRPIDNHTYEFRVPPGRYRLQALSGGLWYVESATAGVTNLMTSDIVVSSGGPGTPIRIVANNLQGMVSVTVKFTGSTDIAYIYLVPKGPSLAQPNRMTAINSGNGPSTLSTRVAAGSYLAIAIDHPIEDDLRNPDVMARFSPTQTVDVSPSATATAELDIAQEKPQ